MRVEVEPVVPVLAYSEFCFLDIDHWFENARRGGRLVGCPECVEQIKEAVELETVAK